MLRAVLWNFNKYITVGQNFFADAINFMAENSIAVGQNPELRHSGIGLENVKKRLGLLFPEQYELKIDSDETVFKVELSIEKPKA